MAVERKEAAFRTPAGLTARWTARGGRIVSLQGPDGREWLSRTSRSSIPAGAAFGDAEMAGWDECAPTIAPCAVDGVELPDHGDLWNARWRLDGATASVEGRVLPYEFRRTASVAAEGALRFEYEARSLAGELPFFWAAHPQFQASAGTTVRLPDGAHIVEEHFPGPRRLERWTTRSGELGALAPGTGRKLFLDPDAGVERAELVHPDGAVLAMRWSPACRFLGLWFDRAAFSDQEVVAIEPALGHGDSLEEGVRTGRAASLEPGRPLRWWIEIDVLSFR